jgi:translation initiation factor 1
MKQTSGLVYSTEFGRMCPECQHPYEQCCCGTKQIAAGDGIVRLRYETKGRKGKGVTLITGIPLPGDKLKTLAKTLKQRCSTGGAVKEGCIEIQGDQRDILQPLLEQQGYKVKRAGG